VWATSLHLNAKIFNSLGIRASRQARHSPRYTTRAEEMLVAQAF
jgi:hypothetical protein